MTDNRSLDGVKEIFTQYLHNTKQRKTPERFAILNRIYKHEGHFNAELLYNAMLNDYRVSLATVYNTLELLQACNLVVKHQFGDQIAQYEKTFGALPHSHIVCTNCGKIKEFSDKKLRTHIQNKKFVQFDVSYYSLYLYGICKKCKVEMTKIK
ncbi:MAG: Fur family transcriptional regulator [Paludibacteraceae bacterium]